MKLDLLDFRKTLVLPFGITAVAHQKKTRSKLHGHGTEAIFLGPSENSSHRSGLFLNKSTREIIVRKSFRVWNERPFYDFLLSENGLPMVQVHGTLESSESDPDPDVPSLQDDSDSDSDSDGDFEKDVTRYQWELLKSKSLSKPNKKLLQRLLSENYLEYDNSSPPQV